MTGRAASRARLWRNRSERMSVRRADSLSAGSPLRPILVRMYGGRMKQIVPGEIRRSRRDVKPERRSKRHSGSRRRPAPAEIALPYPTRTSMRSFDAPAAGPVPQDAAARRAMVFVAALFLVKAVLLAL